MRQGEPPNKISGQRGVRQGTDGGDASLAVLGGHHRRELAEVGVVVGEDDLGPLADQTVGPIDGLRR